MTQAQSSDTTNESAIAKTTNEITNLKPFLTNHIAVIERNLLEKELIESACDEEVEK